MKGVQNNQPSLEIGTRLIHAGFISNPPGPILENKNFLPSFLDARSLKRVDREEVGRELCFQFSEECNVRKKGVGYTCILPISLFRSNLGIIIKAL